MTLKEILDEVLLLSGVGTETAYAASDNDEVLRMVALVNLSIAKLSRHPWQALRATHTFTLSSDTEYSLPSDFRTFLPDTFYTDSRFDPVDFPTSDSEWGMLQATTGGSGISVKARVIGDQIHIYQPDSGETLRVEYISKYPVVDSANAAKQRFTDDDDTTKLDDDLVIKDTLWRYKKLVGLDDWQIDLADFKSYENLLHGHDGGSKTVRPNAPQAFGPYYNLWRSVPNTP